MKARQVLAQYAAGERNFQGVSLRGQSFKGQNLAGADFSGADIRGTDFTGADLTGVKFCGAKAGLQKRWICLDFMVLALIVIFILHSPIPVLLLGLCLFFIVVLGIIVVAAEAGISSEILEITRSVEVLAWGCTSFRGANLTDATFSNAILRYCNFRPCKIDGKLQQTQLTRTCFKKAQNLDRSQLGETILADTKVRKLLIKPESGYKLDLCKANLRGAFLAGANLESANLKQADLSEADLSGANLKDANLTESIAIGTNFTHAYLTGACLEAWNIEPTTLFQGVDCQYIYLLEHPNSLGNRERRPHNPDKVFAPGDFEHLYTELMHTIEILLKGGMNPEAFAAAFQKVMAENPEITFDSIQSIQKKGEDVLVTLEVPLT